MTGGIDSIKNMFLEKGKTGRLQFWTAMSMILVLLWLTVSLPFIYNSTLPGAFTASVIPDIPMAESEDDSLPFSANPAEEKSADGSGSFNEEYHAHAHDQCDGLSIGLLGISRTDHGEGKFSAFHGELLVPPPNRG